MENKKLAYVQAVAHKDIRGKECLYLIITPQDHKEGEDNMAIINIGQKTFDTVSNILENNKQAKLFINEEPKTKTK